MSTPPPAADLHCDVLVVGAGPAGAACATLLAQAGRDVLLVDRSEFPRDKVCGDGLIPDAHAALRRLGVHAAVMARAWSVDHVVCVGPRGGTLAVPAPMAVLPRRELDLIVQSHALRCGARWLGGATYAEALVEDGRVVGAGLRRGSERLQVRARWTVLATGAALAPLRAAGLEPRREPSAMALRGYLHHPGYRPPTGGMEVVWHRQLRRGYGWIFPCGGDVYNVGVGLTDLQRDESGDGARGAGNLRRMLEAFCALHPGARALVDGGTWVGEAKGAPLRFSLEGARSSRPGLLAAGEAIGSTYALTGEGIGKALETGILAAQALLGGGGDASVREHYEAALAHLRPRFALYAQANRINNHPWLADLVIWRARRSARLRARLAGVLEETAHPGDLVSLGGLFKLLLPLR